MATFGTTNVHSDLRQTVLQLFKITLFPGILLTVRMSLNGLLESDLDAQLRIGSF